MLGVLLNVFTVIAGSLLGILFHRGISQKISTAAMTAIGLCSIYMGIDGMLNGADTLCLIVAMVIGSVIGTALDIDGRFNRLSQSAESKFGGKGFSEAFVTASLIFCVGPMTILGGLDAGLKGDNTLYFTKAALDFVSSAMLASAMGVGVIFASLTVLVYQGLMVGLAFVISGFLTNDIITALSCAGSLMIFALGLNLTGIGKFKVANMLPAMIVSPLITWISKLL